MEPADIYFWERTDEFIPISVVLIAHLIKAYKQQSNRLKFISVLIFAKLFICVPMFSPKNFLVERYRLLDKPRYRYTVAL